MELLNDVEDFPKNISRSAVSIGNFDGLHLGHQALLQKLKEVSGGDPKIPKVVMTFSPHPMQVLQPERKMKLLFSHEDQIRMLREAGIDYLIVQAFSRSFSELSAEQFVVSKIFKPLRPAHVVVGYDFAFGANKQGTIEFLKQKGTELCFSVDVIAPVQFQEQIVSSSRIRQLIDEGNILLANQMLGRNFYIEGIVEKGAQRGRQIGIPTANVMCLTATTPRAGVYAGYAHLKGEAKFNAVMNIGTNPTFSESSLQTIEVHILNFNRDIYGRELKIEFVKKLRDEKKFAGVGELVAQIKIDIQAAQKIL
jgi:riboflavin kinase/FMN adenylyltransferase